MLLKDAPLVTCVMAVMDYRAHYVPVALDRYLRGQKGVRTELVIVTDPDSRFALPAKYRNLPDIRVVKCPSKILGRKYELGAQQGNSEIAAKWDDDDWFGPTRLARQLEPILTGQADIVALVEDLALLLPQGTFWKSRHGHRHPYHDGTLVFKREILKTVRFPACSLGESAIFCKRATRRGFRQVNLNADMDFVYVRHGANAWKFKIESLFNPAPGRPVWFPEDDLAAMKAMRCATSPPARG